MIGANQSFYLNFKVTKKDTNNKLIYKLGNGQWNILKLKAVLENILPAKAVFNNFEVIHKFPKIGRRIMLLNARQLDESRLILLAIEDITLKKAIEVKLANYTRNLQRGITTKTKQLEARIEELKNLNKIMVGRELKMIELKNKIDELNGENKCLKK